MLDRAAQPLPTGLGTLDAIHLASALLWNDAMSIVPVMATHDGALGLAAQGYGFKVVGMYVHKSLTLLKANPPGSPIVDRAFG